VQLGVPTAARTACWVMILPQLCVTGLLVAWQQPLHAVAVAALIALQLVLMRRFLQQPSERAVWYSGFGVPLFVIGMMVSAFALRGAA